MAISRRDIRTLARNQEQLRLEDLGPWPPLPCFDTQPDVLVRALYRMPMCRDFSKRHLYQVMEAFHLSYVVEQSDSLKVLSMGRVLLGKCYWRKG
jgi:hypothetical protein